MEIKVALTRERVLAWILLTLALTPLVVTNFVMFPFVLGKAVFMRTIIALFWVTFSVVLFSGGRGEDKKSFSFNFAFVKNPIFVSLFSFMALGAVSTAFALDRTKAIFGTLERSEGYIQLFFSTLLAVAAYMVFQKKDWINFFKITALAGLAVSIDVIVEFMRTGERALGHFINNPAFVGGFLLFVLFSSFLTLVYNRGRVWKYISLLSILLALVGFGATNTRGVLVGLFAGGLAVLIYFIFFGKNFTVRIPRLKWTVGLRRLSTILFASFVLLVVLFVSTIRNPVWKKIPGLDRLSEISLQDNTTQSRLITAKTALRSVNPKTDGVYKLLFGYGPDNFNVAYNSHYDPSVQRYEELWFDRAHNEVLDVLVMHGLFGLAAYLLIWFFVLLAGVRYARKIGFDNFGNDDEKSRAVNLIIGASVIFFAVSYFVQNLFLFDNAVMYVPVFMFWVFSAKLYEETGKRNEADSLKVAGAMKYVAPIVAVGSAALVVMYSYIPMYQVSKFVSALKTKSVIALYDSLDSVTKPYNFAQPEIRFRVLDAASTLVAVKEAKPFVDKALQLEEEALARDPYDPRYFQVEGFVYDSLARAQHIPELYTRAEGLLRTAMSMAPGRQEIEFLLAQNVLSQGRLEEAKQLATEMLAYEPNAPKGISYYVVIMAPIDWDGQYNTADMMYKIYVEDASIFLDQKAFTFIRNGYNSYLQYYYEKRDSDSFLKTLNRSLEIEEFLGKAQQAQFDAHIINQTYEIRTKFIQNGIDTFKRGGWSAINVE